MRSGWLLVLVACSSNHGSVTTDATGDEVGATAVETYAILAANQYFSALAVDAVRVYWGAGLTTGIFAAGK